MNVSEAIEGFVTKVNDAYINVYCAQFPHLIRANAHKAIDGGRKYAKVWSYENGKKSSIFAFIDKTTGDIYKPAGINAPAKGARGNVMSEENGMEAVYADGSCVRYL